MDEKKKDKPETTKERAIRLGIIKPNRKSGDEAAVRDKKREKAKKEQAKEEKKMRSKESSPSSFD